MSVESLGAAASRRPTRTSNFGVSRRESHDASGFYQRFEAPVPEICRGQTTHDYDCDGVDEAIGDGFFAGCEGAAAGCERRSGPLRDSVIDHFDVPPACGTSCIQTQCAVFDGRCRVSAEEIFTALACR